MGEIMKKVLPKKAFRRAYTNSKSLCSLVQAPQTKFPEIPPEKLFLDLNKLTKD